MIFWSIRYRSDEGREAIDEVWESGGVIDWICGVVVDDDDDDDDRVDRSYQRDVLFPLVDPHLRSYPGSGCRLPNPPDRSPKSYDADVSVDRSTCKYSGESTIDFLDDHRSWDRMEVDWIRWGDDGDGGGGGVMDEQRVRIDRVSFSGSRPG